MNPRLERSTNAHAEHVGNTSQQVGSSPSADERIALGGILVDFASGIDRQALTARSDAFTQTCVAFLEATDGTLGFLHLAGDQVGNYFVPHHG